MTNKEIFQLSNQIAKALSQKNLIKNMHHAKQPIFDSIAPILKNYIKPITDKENRENVQSHQSLSDEDLRAQLRSHLATRLFDGTLQAAEIAQLKDIFGLTAKDADTIIEVLDFRTLCDDCPLGRPPQDTQHLEENVQG